jgi:peptidylprolyl isomerase
VFLVTVAMSAAAQTPDSEVVAQRGNNKLTVADLRDLLAHMDPPLRAQLQANPAALANFARERLLRMALLDEAKAKGFDQQPDVIARANDARDGVIVSTYVNTLVPTDPAFPSPAELAAAYEANKAKFALPKQYHLAQIVFPIVASQSAPGASPGDDAKRRALDAHAQAIKPKAEFAELARKLSQDRNTAAQGGDIGWVREDQLDPALRSLVAGLTEGGVSEAVATPTAWVVLKLIATRPPGVAPLADIKDQMVAAMRQTRALQASQGYVNDMLRKEPIQLNEIDLARKVVGSRAP